MAKQFYAVVLLVVVAAVGLANTTGTAAMGRGALVGGWSPLPNVNDPGVQDLGKFAVDEHNRKTGDRLVFVKVISGQSQVVAGTNYKLVLSATRGPITDQTYEAVIYEKPWENIRQLKSFAVIN